MRVAAVDIGTNTVRMLVQDGDETIERDSRITRLGEGVDASRELAEEPMRRTLEVVKEFVGRARDKGAERIRVAGTSAIRDAANRAVFGESVLQATGRPLEVLSGPEEGRLAYSGATSWLPESEHVVCDIGGGSTELITERDVVSADVGSVRVRERYLEGDPPVPSSVETALAAVKAILVGNAVQERIGPGQLVGVAGTITTIAALDAGLKAYDPDIVHGYHLSREGAARWANDLNRLSAAQIKELGPVNPGRADVIGAGALVLDAVMDVLHRESLIVSERDILDGLVADVVR